MIDAYQEDDHRRAPDLLASPIDSIATGVPAGLDEITRLTRTLNQRRTDILAYVDHPRFHGRTHQSH